MLPISFAAIRAFAGCSRANVALIFSLLVLPVIGMIGLAADYGMRLNYVAKFDAAADSSVLAALSKAEADLQAGKTTAVAIADGISQGTQQFNAFIGPAASLITSPVSVSVSVSGTSITATVNFYASSPTTIGQIFNVSSFPISGSSSGTATLPKYLSFYLLLDVSGSMGIPSTNSGQTRLASINPDFKNLYPGGCTFACHFTTYAACQDANGNSTYCQGYNLTRTNGTSSTPVSLCSQPDTSACIQLRVDAVAYAVQQLLQTAQTTATMTNQFSVGIFPFIRWMQVYQPVTTSLTTVSTAAANLTAFLDNGNGSSSLGSGGTHFENAITSVNASIINVGDGLSAAAPQPFVFLVTDGAQDNQYQYSNGSWSGSNSATTLDETNCALLKLRGITVSVLYIPYLPIQNPTTIWGNEDGYANANIPYIPAHLQACASTGFFFTANSPSDITTAMQAMFAQSVQASRLTK
jgi:hypothetical protein